MLCSTCFRRTQRVFPTQRPSFCVSLFQFLLVMASQPQLSAAIGPVAWQRGCRMLGLEGSAQVSSGLASRGRGRDMPQG